MNFAVLHMNAAARFARRSGEIEEGHKGEACGDFYNEIVADVSATIIMSVAVH